jgi:2-polyprenyl-3-methyl-5-hydroxy-6-metoxy-1,4-benzoquinol methylase
VPDAASSDRPAHGRGSAWDTPEAVARVRDAYRTPDVVALRTAQIDLLGRLTGVRTLDIGCGPGIYARDLALRGATVTAIDSAPLMVEAAVAEANAAGVGIATAVADVTDLPFDDGAFDLAVLVQVIEYVPNAVAALREIHRVLAPGGGRLLISDTDWTTAAWSIGDAATEEAVKRAWCAQKPHPDAGRRIPSWLRAAGFTIEAWAPLLLTVSDPFGDTFLGHTWPGYRRQLDRSGGLDTSTLDRFDALSRTAAEEGTFSFCVTRHSWVARTAGASA